jgi:hypothetical protein
MTTTTTTTDVRTYTPNAGPSVEAQAARAQRRADRTGQPWVVVRALKGEDSRTRYAIFEAGEDDGRWLEQHGYWQVERVLRPDLRKLAFSKWPVVEARSFGTFAINGAEDKAYIDQMYAMEREGNWGGPIGLQHQTFDRHVRAGGEQVPVRVVVFRRRPTTN